MPINRSTLLPFFQENAHNTLGNAYKLLHEELNHENLAVVHRAFHSIGSSAGMMQLENILQTCRKHEAECNAHMLKKTLPTENEIDGLIRAIKEILAEVDAVTL